MGVTKRFMYSDSVNDIANYAKVFAHPARLTILKYISEHDGCICNDLVHEVGLSQTTISQHLTVISNVGLIQSKFKNRNTYYYLNLERFNNAQLFLNAFLKQTALSAAKQ